VGVGQGKQVSGAVKGVGIAPRRAFGSTASTPSSVMKPPPMETTFALEQASLSLKAVKRRPLGCLVTAPGGYMVSR